MNIIDSIKGGGMQCIAQDITAFSYLGADKDMGQIDLCRKSKATQMMLLKPNSPMQLRFFVDKISK